MTAVTRTTLAGVGEGSRARRRDRRALLAVLVGGLAVAFGNPALASSGPGPTGSTLLVKDINGGSADSTFIDGTLVSPAFAVFDDRLYFRATDGSSGAEPWVTDGTATGTVMLKDINAGPAGSAASFERYEFTELAGKLYFAADDGIHGRELWVTDGTAPGTVMVKDINPGVEASLIDGFTEFDGKLYFSAHDGVHGSELWATDGTQTGTAMVKDIWPGTGWTPSTPAGFIELGGKLYFGAHDGTHGREPWVTDGTEGGTAMVRDVNPGLDSSGFFAASALDGKLYFAADDGTHGRELWVTDGTAAGTALVKDINPGSSGSNLDVRSELDGRLYLRADDGTHGGEVWATDGTTSGTVLVKDINPGPAGSVPRTGYGFVPHNGKVFFAANDGTHEGEPWVSDGTEAGTRLLADLNPTGSSVGEATGPGFTALQGKLYFDADDGTHGQELWLTNGVAAGTRLVADLNPGAGHGSPFSLQVLDSRLYFTAADGVHGHELWVTGKGQLKNSP